MPVTYIMLYTLTWANLKLYVCHVKTLHFLSALKQFYIQNIEFSKSKKLAGNISTFALGLHVDLCSKAAKSIDALSSITNNITTTFLIEKWINDSQLFWQLFWQLTTFSQQIKSYFIYGVVCSLEQHVATQILGTVSKLTSFKPDWVYKEIIYFLFISFRSTPVNILLFHSAIPSWTGLLMVVHLITKSINENCASGSMWWKIIFCLLWWWILIYSTRYESNAVSI